METQFDERIQRVLGHVDARIMYAEYVGTRYMKQFHRYKVIILALSVIVASFSGFKTGDFEIPSWVITICGALIAFFTGLLALSKSDDKALQAKLQWSKLFRERFLFQQEAGPYSSCVTADERIKIFTEKIAEYEREFTEAWLQTLTKSK